MPKIIFKEDLFTNWVCLSLFIQQLKEETDKQAKLLAEKQASDASANEAKERIQQLTDDVTWARLERDQLRDEMKVLEEENQRIQVEGLDTELNIIRRVYLQLN